MTAFQSLVAAVAALSLGIPVDTRAQAPELTLEGDARAGHVTAEWAPAQAPVDEGFEYQLQQAPSMSFEQPEIRYQGQHTASMLSGLPDGTFFYRVRKRPGPGAEWSAWSEPKRFEVQHHPLELALGLFAVGAIVFGSILAFLVFTSRRVHHG